MAGHTKGPWIQIIDREAGHISIHPAGRRGEIGLVHMTEPNGEADAHLIAAAPDLLAACQAIEAHCRVETPETRGNPAAHAAEGKRLREQMRVAIAKAEGKS